MPDQTMEERVSQALGDHYIMYRLSEWLCTGHRCAFASESFNEAMNHQAAVVASFVREAQAKAWDEGKEAGMLDYYHAPNPYRGEGA